jgi:hypothetical protein
MKVKDFDIGFSVCLREKVYVLQGEGGAVENELLPYFTLSVSFAIVVAVVFSDLSFVVFIS